ncbi:protein CYR61-like isoform X2 [Scleropages formosus]|uniref:protein CYR61-like isoform X2 n=1 Tax=Scleropages formosus TaxID=113540 RepID=UPI0010FAA48C|nr:protein CYR61-like isoform X2 [Scleropages formosus]
MSCYAGTPDFTLQVGAGCPAVCKCSAAPTVCPPGVSRVADGCGCCKVCAAQLNRDCGPARPCDHHKGLECNYGNGASRSRGICRARLEGRTCEYGGRVYQNGESFRVGCKHHCTCVDGGVGCVPLCPAHVPLASPACPAPRLVKVPGRCCLQLDCRKGRAESPPGPLPYPYPHKPGKASPNELLEIGKGWEKKQSYKQLAAWQQAGQRCVLQTTDWSRCSRSCGTGVSTRVSSHNARCELVKETRLCTVRPCGAPPAPRKEGRRCSRTQKAPEPLRLSYGGCRSVRLYRPNYCGVCVDGGCCTPLRTRTATVLFSCPGGELVEQAVMFVRSCKCGGEDCDHLNEAALAPQRWLHGDTHKFID